MITVEVTVRVTVDVSTEKEARNWLIDVLEKNFNEVGEAVEIVESSTMCLDGHRSNLKA